MLTYNVASFLPVSVQHSIPDSVAYDSLCQLVDQFWNTEKHDIAYTLQCSPNSNAMM